MKVNQWSKDKPHKPCIVAVRWEHEGKLDFDLFKLYLVIDYDDDDNMVGGLCFAQRNNIGEWEDCEIDYEDWNYDEYMILEVKDEKLS